MTLQIDSKLMTLPKLFKPDDNAGLTNHFDKDLAGTGFESVLPDLDSSL